MSSAALTGKCYPSTAFQNCPLTVLFNIISIFLKYPEKLSSPPAHIQIMKFLFKTFASIARRLLSNSSSASSPSHYGQIVVLKAWVWDGCSSPLPKGWICMLPYIEEKLKGQTTYCNIFKHQFPKFLVRNRQRQHNDSFDHTIAKDKRKPGWCRG